MVTKISYDHAVTHDNDYLLLNLIRLNFLLCCKYCLLNTTVSDTLLTIFEQLKTMSKPYISFKMGGNLIINLLNSNTDVCLHFKIIYLHWVFICIFLFLIESQIQHVA